MDSNSKAQWTQSNPQEALDQLGVSQQYGLKSDEVLQRRQRFGPNTLREQQPTRVWTILLQQLKSLIVLLLFLAAVVSFALGDWVEALAIVLVLVINTLIGFTMEIRATRSMEALRRLGRTLTTVTREGELLRLDAEELVPGDVVSFEGGDKVTADLRLVEASRLSVDESALTGESVPVEKSIESLPGEPVLADRVNMLFKGTSVTNGSGQGVVVATGMSTELGHIAHMTYEAEDEITPLEKRLDKLGQRLALLSLILVSVVGLVGVLVGKDLALMFETAVALAVATIPEGLPIVATIALARGMWTMAKRNALINRLSAVEALGATTVIVTDKTGTLTENKMSVLGFETEEGWFDSGSDLSPSLTLDLAVRVGALCGNASLDSQQGEPVGDPMEVALLQAAEQLGLSIQNLKQQYPEIREDAFDPETRLMATVHKDGDGVLVAVKGAPEAVLFVSTHMQEEKDVLPMSEELKEHWLQKNESLATKGYRMLALAYKSLPKLPESDYSELTFIGLVAFVDPPRKEVKEAIGYCKDAGIQVVMVTGDQKATAQTIGAQIGLSPQRIHSRVSPEQKLQLVQGFQSTGEVVAMTGDGVNDAPALKKADIGVAMGERGTQVAREASDIVLKDDNFASIVAAIQQGRVVFSNIRRFVVYLLSCNISEVLVVLIATLVNAPLPILPIQILFLNLVTDVFPALALGMGEGDISYLHQPPRKPKESVVTRRHWWAIGGYGALITLSVLASFVGAFMYLKVDQATAVTISFLTMAFAQVFHVFNMRDSQANMLVNDVTKNPHIWGAVVLCMALLIVGVQVEMFRTLLKLVTLNFDQWLWVQWLWVGGWSLVPLVVGQFLQKGSSRYLKAESVRQS